MSKVVVEFDSEEAFTQMFKRRDGQGKFLKALYDYLRGKVIVQPGATPLTKYARVKEFVNSEEGGILYDSIQPEETFTPDERMIATKFRVAVDEAPAEPRNVGKKKKGNSS